MGRELHERHPVPLVPDENMGRLGGRTAMEGVGPRFTLRIMLHTIDWLGLSSTVKLDGL